VVRGWIIDPVPAALPGTRGVPSHTPPQGPGCGLVLTGGCTPSPSKRVRSEPLTRANQFASLDISALLWIFNVWFIISSEGTIGL
jgi:hypothetical protein